MVWKVSYIPYKGIVGVWTVCTGIQERHRSDKTYGKCKALLNKDLAGRRTVGYRKVDATGNSGALYRVRLQRGRWQFQNIDGLYCKINQGDIRERIMN